MFWGDSSKRTGYGSSEYDFSDGSDQDQESYSRLSRRSPKKSQSKRHQCDSKRPRTWFGGMFSSRAETPPKRPPKKGKKFKRHNRVCRPQSSQEWGLLFLTLLLFVYLADFVSLLYRDSGEIRTISERRISRRTTIPDVPRLNRENKQSAEENLKTTQVEEDSLHTKDHRMSQKAGKFAAGASSLNTLNVQSHPSILKNQLSHSIEDRSRSESASVDATETRVGVPDMILVKHPMNRNMHDLEVPGETGELSTSSVKEYYRKLAKAYLMTFTNGIYRQLHFDILRRRTYSLTPPGANKGVQTMLFQIIDGKVHLMDPYEVPRNSKPFYRTRINQVIWLLSKLATEGRIKNTEFLMAIHDCVQTVNKEHSYRGAHFPESNPAFTIVTCNFSDNIPFPMWEGSKYRDGGLSGWDETVKKYAEDDIDWDEKQGKAVFRGGNRPSMYFKNKTDADLHCNDVGRTRLQYLAKQHPDILDVSIGGTCGGVHTALQRLEPREHHRYKYILYAEGNCMWADRIRTQVFGPSMIIKQETPCGQFFEPLMKANTHYLPTDFFFRDTTEKVSWARQNDAQARQVVKNAKEFANNFLTLNGIEIYVEVLLEEYTKLLVEPDIKLENGAIDVTGKKV